MALALGLVVVAGAGRGDDGPETTAPETTTTTAADWVTAQHEVVTGAREALWRQDVAPEPPERLEVESVTVEEIDGAQVAILRTCAVQRAGDTFDIFGGMVEQGQGHTTSLNGEVMGWVGGSWTFGTRLAQPGRRWEGEAGCATD